MKYILLLILTFPIFSQAIDNSKSTSTDNADNPTKTIEPEKESSQINTEPKDNTNLTQAEIRKKRKLEIGIGYGEGNDKFSETPGFLNLNLEYNLTSRFSFGYSHLHKQKFSTSPYTGSVILFGNASIAEKTNSTEVGLLNFRYYFFEKIPLYITGGVGRDYVSHYKQVQYQYGWYLDGTIQNSPVIRETSTLPANYKFLGFGFQWIFQNGFFIGVEAFELQSRYTYKGNFLVLNKNYDPVNGIFFENLVNSTYKEDLNTGIKIFRFGYSLQF